ncbi:MAG: penicillin acylase family protein [Alphaproteobacteria bacterium]|nr:penicillin acylase family protein [Alphaproteobacteria bacterium]
MRLVALLALCLTALAACAQFAHKTQNTRTATLIRDEWGVPHIFAANEEAGFYALGYATAQDRLERFVGLVLYSRGQLASLLGPKFLDGDIRNRHWRHRDMAQAALTQLSPPLRRNYDAFLAGMKAFAAEPGVKPELAAAAKQLDVADLLAVSRALLFAGYQQLSALAECGVDGMTYSNGYLPYRSTARERASNGWAVMPSRTAAGALILASDPHVDVESPAYYEFHMQAGALHTAGYAMGPMLWQTHTEHVAWSMTTGNPDYLDCYAVQTDASDPRAYLFDGKRQTIEARTEKFDVAGGQPVERILEYTRHNGLLSPVVARRGQVAFVASAADMDRAGLVHEEIYRMNFARSTDDVKAALATMSMFPQNLIIGDAAGHMLYIRAGRVPVRPDGYDWTKPVPGNTSATAWRGMRTIDDLVQVKDPAAGFLQNNNAAPDAMAPGLDDLARRYAPDIFFDAPGRQTTRGLRSLQVLSARDRMTLDDAMGLAFDENWVTVPDWTGALKLILAKWPALAPKASPESMAAIDRLLAFDGQAHAESQAAADFYGWRIEAGKRLAKLPDRWFVEANWDHAKITRPFAVALIDGLVASVDGRVKRYGKGVIRLGDVMRVNRGKVEAPVGGVTLDSDLAPLCVEQVRAVCDRTMRAFGVAPLGDTGRFHVVRGSQSMRIVQFTKPLQAYSLYAFGQSDDPASPHYADQVKLFSEKRMKRSYFSRAELEGHITAEKTLTMPATR